MSAPYDLCEALKRIDERERPEAIRAALAEHGFPPHLLGLFGKLWSYAMDVPYHSRDRAYSDVMAICDGVFDALDRNPER